ncbi:hypothetical protein KXV85_004427, partial [Aspergillus fumigatus]
MKLGVSVTAMLAFHASAHAQDAATATGNKQLASSVDASDIVVTAQRKSEKLQNVGIAVAAYSGIALRSQG